MGLGSGGARGAAGAARIRFVATLVLLAASATGSTSSRPAQDLMWHKAADFTSMQHWDGALCDPKGLEAVHCNKEVWRVLLEEMCRHCQDGRCVSSVSLAKIAFEVIHLYTSMIIQHGESLLTDFGCKHGVAAALAFHAEHVGFEFRPPQATVDLIRSDAELDFQIGADDRFRLNEVLDDHFRRAGITHLMVEPRRLTITGSKGQDVSLAANDLRMEDFPLRIRYRTPEDRREFLNIRRHFMMDQMPVLMNLNLRVGSLSPFPLHTGKLRAMRLVDQDEYDQLVADVSSKLSGVGIFHFLMDGDSTARYLSTHFGYLNTSGFLTQNFGLSPTEGAPDTDSGATSGDGRVERSSIFVPLELRGRIADLLWSPGNGPAGLGGHLHVVELGVGHIQVGELAYGFASGLNFRVFCPHCAWVSIYFYVTEAKSSAAGATSVLPLAFWLPCRLEATELFPVKHERLGRGPEVSVPLAQSWRRRTLGDVANEAEEEEFGLLRGLNKKKDIYGGTCRESLQRILARAGYASGAGSSASIPASGSQRGSTPPPALPVLLPELLPFHDISSLLEEGTNLDMLIAIKQLHTAPGLEMYQDKITLSKTFSGRGLRVPRLFYSSEDPDFDVRPILRDLWGRQEAYVAKASHMCCSMGVFVMDGGVDRQSGERRSPDEIQEGLQYFFQNPFKDVTPKCGDWGTVKAGEKPGVLVEELMRPSVPVQPLLERLGLSGGSWVTPDIVACHLVWSTLLHCVWEMKLRGPKGEDHTEELGMFFRDGSCVSCRHPMPFRGDWPGTVALLENLLPGADYIRITLFVDQGRPVLNEIEYTCGGLETVPVRIAREWTLRWLEGYHQYKS
eukprot:TRINITY_DN3352_c0_g1_i1.p1 TRINITY_DN3352_c0_g1~~TRINITY_DN3352_c0_g1_i1.p1  ORF type:complete len:846 (-),score=136.66 TRINITY_DN3352_c0_g1_i1:51-2588(-)